MSKNQKENQAENKAVSAAASSGLNCFDMSATKVALTEIASAKSEETTATGKRVNSSMTLALIGEAYHLACAKITEDHSLVMSDYRENWALVLKVFAAEKHPFVVITASEKEGEADTVKWNTTANNAISTAKGVVDFALDPASCLNPKGENTWTAVQQEVQRLRAERRDEENPEAARMAEAKEKAKKAFIALAEVIFRTGDIGLINDLTIELDLMTEVAVEAIAEQAKIEATAKDIAAKELTKTIADAKAKIESEAEDMAAIEAQDNESAPVAEAA